MQNLVTLNNPGKHANSKYIHIKLKWVCVFDDIDMINQRDGSYFKGEKVSKYETNDISFIIGISTLYFRFFL